MKPILLTFFAELMGRKNKNIGLVMPHIEILRAGAEGKCVAKPDGKVLFVDRVVPGDIADVIIKSDRKGYMEGSIVKLIQAGEGRTETFCEHWDTCGGCQWQQMDYSHQLKWKHQQVLDAFERIAKVPVENIYPIVGADHVTAYRNKVEFSFTSKAWVDVFDKENPEHRDIKALGYFKAGKFDKIFNVNYCHLVDEVLNKIRNKLRDFCMEKGYTFFDLYKKTGLMRGVMLRNSTLGEVLILVMFGEDDTEAIKETMYMLETEFPEITSLHSVVNTKMNDTFSDLEIITHKGPGYISEKLGDLTFHISPKSFFQTNPYQAKKLYDLAKSFAGLSGNEHVYDLYCGTGTIGLYVANQCKKVTGVEYISDAVIDAGVNAKNNHIEHISFHAGDMVKVLNDEFILLHGKPDVIITDPPRAGMHEDVVKKILEIAPEKIVYVSCNPSTQARDVQWLSEKYDVKSIQPVDMFPHTHHVENIALLILKK